MMNAKVEVADATHGLASVLARYMGRSVVIVTLLIALPVLAHGRSDDADWICWHGHAKAVHCQLSSIENAYHADDGASAVSSVEPGSDALYAALPRLARAILSDPHSLEGRRIEIPMFSEPEDEAFMVELAEAVMCAGKRNCTVRFLEGLAEIALLFDELDDPALN